MLTLFICNTFITYIKAYNFIKNICEIIFDEGLLVSYLFCETCLPVCYPHIMGVTLVTEHARRDIRYNVGLESQGQDACRRQALILSHRYVGQNCLYNYIMYTTTMKTTDVSLF